MRESFWEKYFELKKRETDAGTEIIAGIVTFMTMAYIIFVNPSLLSKGGVNFEAALVATVLSAAITTIMLGLYANLPFALAAGMGYNVFFAFTLCGVMKIPWQVGLGCVFWDGVIFLIISILPWRDKIISGIPMSIKFDTVGSISGLAAKLNIIDEKGSFPNAEKVLVTDATAPALILVGLFMMEPILKIDFKDITEGLPAFLTIIMIPLTYNIAHGLVFGVVSYTVVKLISGRAKEVHPLMYILTVILILYYAVGRVG